MGTGSLEEAGLLNEIRQSISIFEALIGSLAPARPEDSFSRTHFSIWSK